MNNATLLSIIAISISGSTLIWNILWSIHREFATSRLKVIFYVGAIYHINEQQFFVAEWAIADSSINTIKMSDWKI